MTTLITQDEVVQCVKQELELTGIADKKHAAPDLSQLLPEVKCTIVEVLLLHTRGNQAQAARMLSISKKRLLQILPIAALEWNKSRQREQNVLYSSSRCLIESLGRI
ncbi:hypothetical protein ACXZ7R_25365 [Vibrio campbellii]